MSIFNLISGGFIVCLGIILLLCGLIMIYVKQRFASYDRHLTEQSQLLKHVVASIENNMVHNTRGQGQLASTTAIEAARRISRGGNTNGVNGSDDNKIIVSDDEASSNENESDNDSDNDDSSESVDDDESESENSRDEKRMKLLQAQNKLTLDVLAGLPHKPSISPSSIEDSDVDLDIHDNDDNENDSSDSDSESSHNIDISVKSDGIKLVELDEDELTSSNVKEFNHINNHDDSTEDLHIRKIDDTNTNKKTIVNLDVDFELDVGNSNHYETKKIVTTNLENSLDKDKLAHLKDLKKQQLQELCKERNLNINGTRLELIKRLSE